MCFQIVTVYLVFKHVNNEVDCVYSAFCIAVLMLDRMILVELEIDTKILPLLRYLICKLHNSRRNRIAGAIKVVDLLFLHVNKHTHPMRSRFVMRIQIKNNADFLFSAL